MEWEVIAEITSRVRCTWRSTRKVQIRVGPASSKPVCGKPNLEQKSMSTGSTSARVLLRFRGSYTDTDPQVQSLSWPLPTNVKKSSNVGPRLDVGRNARCVLSTAPSPIVRPESWTAKWAQTEQISFTYSIVFYTVSLTEGAICM